MTDPMVITITSVIVLLSVALGWVVSKVWPVVRRFVRFVDDVTGQPARGGRPARPGLMERVTTIEDQVKNHHTTNLRDDVDALGERLDKHVEHSAPMLAMMEDLHETWGTEGRRNARTGLR